MPKCTFCKKQYEFPRRLTVVRGSDGMVRYFCSSRCRKNFIMGRDNKKVNWVRKYKVSKEQEIEALKKSELEKELEAKAKKEAAMETGGKKIGG